MACHFSCKIFLGLVAATAVEQPLRSKPAERRTHFAQSHMTVGAFGQVEHIAANGVHPANGKMKLMRRHGPKQRKGILAENHGDAKAVDRRDVIGAASAVGSVENAGNTTCEDKHDYASSCGSWKSHGYCSCSSRYGWWMQIQCCQTCNGASKCDTTCIDRWDDMPWVPHAIEAYNRSTCMSFALKDKCDPQHADYNKMSTDCCKTCRGLNLDHAQRYRENPRQESAHAQNKSMSALWILVAIKTLTMPFRRLFS